MLECFKKVRLVALLAAALPGGCAGPAITLSPAGEGPRVVRVGGLSDETLASWSGAEPTRRQGTVHVWVGSAPADAPALLGEVSRRGAALVFSPRFPLEPGVAYVAQFDPALPAVQARGGAPVSAKLLIPLPPPGPRVSVAAIYPSGGELPENLLKFYIQFSGEMSRGEAYRHIHLIDDAGKEVPVPFLELAEELWNPEITRFTLFFDPGRIKSGLVPRLEAGLALEAGRTYTLRIDADWHDGINRPLTAATEKKFRVIPADAVQPDPAHWRVMPPAAGTTGPLQLQFDEPLDFALVQRAITVRGSGGDVAGGAAISQNERAWSFTPKAPWSAGRYTLVVQTILEDNAGNSLGRAFEVDVSKKAEPDAPGYIEIPFLIVPG